MRDHLTITAKQFGFSIREVAGGRTGYFIAPIRANGAKGDDCTLIKHNGEIVPYDGHDAQAHLCAKAVANALQYI